MTCRACRACGQAYLTPYQLRALAAAASLSKAAGIPAVIAAAEREIQRRIAQEEEGPNALSRPESQPEGSPPVSATVGAQTHIGAGNKAGPESAGNTPEALTTDSSPALTQEVPSG